MLAVDVLHLLQLLGVLVRRVAQEPLQVGHPLLHGGVVGRGGTEILGLPRDGVRVLRVALLEGLDLRGVPVRDLVDGLLDGAEALEHGAMVSMRSLEGGHLFRMAAVRVFQGLHLRTVLLRRLRAASLERLHPRAQRAVVLRVQAAERLQVLRMLPLRSHHLRVCLLELLQLLAVPVSRIPNTLLQVVDPVGERGVVRVRGLHARQLARVPLVGRLQRLQLPGMVAGGIAHDLLDVLHTLLHGRMCAVDVSQALQMLVMGGLEVLERLVVLVR
mmetsp:Transcript_31657/g.83231  ORF Transcript_31657/g.83231 Transcript_31657/m.83231 type:complete len:273 (-) Transcript_31657:1062-1880(-)